MLGLDSSEPLRRPIAGVSAVVNAAGPFFETGRPLRKHCLEAGVSYIDVNGEIGDFLQAMKCDAEARKSGVAVIPGAGFGVVFGESVAAHVARRLPDARWLRLSLAPVDASTSHGAARSTAAVLAEGGYAVADGVLRRRPTAFETWRVAEKNGQCTPRFAAAPRAEIVAAHRVTGVKDIVAGVPLSLPAALALRVAGRLVGSALMRKTSTERGETSVAQSVSSRPRRKPSRIPSRDRRRLPACRRGRGARAGKAARNTSGWSTDARPSLRRGLRVVVAGNADPRPVVPNSPLESSA